MELLKLNKKNVGCTIEHFFRLKDYTPSVVFKIKISVESLDRIFFTFTFCYFGASIKNYW